MQATISFPVVDKENINNVASKKNERKRTITTADGEDIDLTKESEVVEAMKQRISRQV